MIRYFRELEKGLMLLATHYIEKDRNLRGISRVNKKTESARRRQVKFYKCCRISWGFMSILNFPVISELENRKVA
jgi:hypothetical protein